MNFDFVRKGEKIYFYIYGQNHRLRVVYGNDRESRCNVTVLVQEVAWYFLLELCDCSS